MSWSDELESDFPTASQGRSGLPTLKQHLLIISLLYYILDTIHLLACPQISNIPIGHNHILFMRIINKYQYLTPWRLCKQKIGSPQGFHLTYSRHNPKWDELSRVQTDKRILKGRYSQSGSTWDLSSSMQVKWIVCRLYIVGLLTINSMSAKTGP